MGVFETLLVLDGRPVEPEAHLARLHTSLDALYPHLIPPSLDVPVERGPYGHRSTGTSAEALRIVVAPGEGELVVTIRRRTARESWPGGGGGSAATAVSLHGVSLPGGLGAHKWADRSLLDEVQAGLPAGALPLLVDRDGAVLEASRANVFAVTGGVLATPPLDGRILPGVTRARVLAIAASLGIDACETALRREDLLGAEEVFLTGSVRGIEPVRSLDGTALLTRGEVAPRLATELRRSWAGAAQVG